MNIANMIIEKMCFFYDVKTAAELSEKINTSQKTISNWKIRNSIGAIKKKCRELGIYYKIFDDIELYEKSNLLNDKDYVKFEQYFDEIFNYYNVSTIKELSDKTDIPASTISNWSQRKSISALKKITKKLGIYEKIFDEDEQHYDTLNLKFNISQRKNILEKQCKKYGIQTTTIKNLRLLYLFEQIDTFGYKQIDDIELDLKEILFKIQKDSYYVRTYGRDKYLENLERNQKEYLEQNIGK